MDILKKKKERKLRCTVTGDHRVFLCFISRTNSFSLRQASEFLNFFMCPWTPHRGLGWSLLCESEPLPPLSAPRSSVSLLLAASLQLTYRQRRVRVGVEGECVCEMTRLRLSRGHWAVTPPLRIKNSPEPTVRRTERHLDKKKHTRYFQERRKETLFFFLLHFLASVSVICLWPLSVCLSHRGEELLTTSVKLTA